MMSSTEQLTRLCRGAVGFLGVFGADQLPNKPPRNSSLIANYSPSNLPGTHWVGMANLNGDGPARFFDSYGEAADGDDNVLARRTNFYEYLRRNGNGLSPAYNRVDLQAIRGPNNNTCGEWASFFILSGGQLPRVERNSFAEPWSLYELDRRQLPRLIRKYDLPFLAKDEKDEQVAQRNDIRVRRWANIIPVHH